MAQEINLGGTIYVSSKRAAEITGYTQDYIGQLARAGHITAQRVSGLWYVVEESLRSYKSKADEFKPTPPPPHTRMERQMESSISFDGKDYVSAQRAADITGYHPDYVGQLARTGKVISRQVGTRWFVDREGIVEHKRYNDALLAAVQSESVGLLRPEPQSSDNVPPLHFSYTNVETHESSPETQVATQESEDDSEVQPEESITEIPIRVIKNTNDQYLGKPRATPTRSYAVFVSSVITVFALVLIPAAGGMYYLYTNKGGTSPLLTRGVTTVSQIASALLPTQGTIKALKLPDAVANVVSKSLYYRRDSF